MPSLFTVRVALPVNCAGPRVSDSEPSTVPVITPQLLEIVPETCTAMEAASILPVTVAVQLSPSVASSVAVSSKSPRVSVPEATTVEEPSASRVRVTEPEKEPELTRSEMDPVTVPLTTPARLVSKPSVTSTVVPSTESEPLSVSVQLSASV